MAKLSKDEKALVSAKTRNKTLSAALDAAKESKKKAVAALRSEMGQQVMIAGVAAAGGAYVAYDLEAKWHDSTKEGYDATAVTVTGVKGIPLTTVIGAVGAGLGAFGGLKGTQRTVATSAGTGFALGGLLYKKQNPDAFPASE